MEEKPAETNAEDSLESTPSTASNSSQDSESLEGGSTGSQPEAPKTSTAGRGGIGAKIRGLIFHLNIYLLLFVLILVITAGFIVISVQRNKKAAGPTSVNTQTLSADELKKLTEQEQKVGDPKSTLAIESNAIFNGKVLVRDSLDVAGTIKVGGALSLPGISVSGESSFDQIRANNLAITGNTSVQGQLNVQKGITSSGGGSFSGPLSAPMLTVGSLQLTGDLQIIRHIDAGGGTPGKSDGSALGSGGTVTVSGTDTAGTITINTGGGPGAGCFVTVTFTQKFNGNPHVVISPVGSAAAGLNYYVNRSSSNFSVCTANAPGGGQSFSFDYVAID